MVLLPAAILSIASLTSAILGFRYSTSFSNVETQSPSVIINDHVMVPFFPLENKVPSPVLSTRRSSADSTSGKRHHLTEMLVNCDQLLSKPNSFGHLIKTAPIVGCLIGLNQKVPESIDNLSIMTPFNDHEALRIVGVLHNFVSTQHSLLSTIIEKRGKIYTRPIRVALLDLESVVDQLTYAIIDLIPTRQPEGSSAKSVLDRSFNQAIRIYS
ncbi:secreted protein [Melampsora americana]|nr:secreted protein [Melampsora americana]